MTRKCKLCGVVKPLSEFVTNKTCKDGVSHRCKVCDNEDRQNKHLMRKYGITLEQKNQMIQLQEGKCAICRLDLVTFFNSVVDHNHETGQVRQILCRQCNAGLGSFFENIESLQRAIDYLIDHREA